MTSLPSSACAADAMNIILSNIGEVEIHDMGQLLNINAASGNVRSNKNTHITLFETLECTSSRTLTFIAVNRSSSQSLFIQSFCHTIRSILGARKNEDLLPTTGANKVTQQIRLALHIARVNDLIN